MTTPHVTAITSERRSLYSPAYQMYAASTRSQTCFTRWQKRAATPKAPSSRRSCISTPRATMPGTKRTEQRQAARALARATADELRANATLDRAPAEWPEDMDYPSRTTRRSIGRGGMNQSKVVTERMNRSDARPAKTERARRVRSRRRDEAAKRRITAARGW